jgi:GTP-binding protein
VYASGRAGWATTDLDQPANDMRAIFESIVHQVPVPKDDVTAPLQMLVTTLDWSDYVGRIGIGRVFAGSIRVGQTVAVMKRDGKRKDTKVGKLLRFEGLGRQEVEQVNAGDLCAVIGIEGVDIGDTLADPVNPVALVAVTIDEPTMTMTFRINDSPFAGQDGQYVTSRQIRERLMRELETNVALKVELGRTSDEFIVSGRGLLHLGILLETMRREGYELSVGKPEVILKTIDGVLCEPMESLVIDAPNAAVGSVMELIGSRKGELVKMEPRGENTMHMLFKMTSRALIGLRGRVLTATQGEAIMHHRFDTFVPASGESMGRLNGVIISTEGGQVTPYAVGLAADRGVLFVGPGEQVYAGQIVGEHNRDNDLPFNISRTKHLDNMRAASKDATVTLKAPRKMSLEQCLEYIEEDELVEITPKCIRLRKRILDEGLRRRAERQAKDKERATAEA